MTRGLWARLATILALGVVVGVRIAGAQAPTTVAGLDVVLVLDHSGSMKQNDPQRLMVKAAQDFVRRLGPDDAAGLVVFGGQARAVYPVAPLALPGKREGLLAEIEQIRYADPRTNFSVGIERGMYELKQHGRARATPVLIFITDGLMDTGSKAKDTEMREWLRTHLLPEVRQRGIRLFSVALTEQADYPLIQEMASVTGGDYFRALSVQEIPGIFDKIRERIEQRLPASPPPQALPSPPGPAAGSGPMLVLAWFWIAAGAGLAALLVGGTIMVRRLRKAAVPAVPARPARAAAPSRIPQPPPSPAEAQVPPAHLRDMRTRKAIQLTKAVTRIGREPDNDLVIPQRQVSGHHAEIECRQGHFYLRDLRSTNGTWINNQRVETETMLKSGDVIRFDEYAYSFSGPDMVGGGTMVRDLREGTPVSEAPRPRPAARDLAETLVLDTDSTVDDSVGPTRCPAHANFEATERCERCGNLWCALCNPPVPGHRVCRRCREMAEGHPQHPVSR